MMAQIGSVGGLGLTAETTHLVAGLMRARDSLERFKKSSVPAAAWAGQSVIGVNYGRDFLESKPEPPALTFAQRRKLRLLAPWKMT